MLRHWRVSRCWAFSSERRRQDRLKKCSLNYTIKTHSTTSSEQKTSPLLRGTQALVWRCVEVYKSNKITKSVLLFFRWIEAFQEAMILWLVWIGLNGMKRCHLLVSALCTQAVSLKMLKSRPSLKQRMMVVIVYALIYFKHPNEGQMSGGLVCLHCASKMWGINP